MKWAQEEILKHEEAYSLVPVFGAWGHRRASCAASRPQVTIPQGSVLLGTGILSHDWGSDLGSVGGMLWGNGM